MQRRTVVPVLIFAAGALSSVARGAVALGAMGNCTLMKYLGLRGAIFDFNNGPLYLRPKR